MLKRLSQFVNFMLLFAILAIFSLWFLSHRFPHLNTTSISWWPIHLSVIVAFLFFVVIGLILLESRSWRRWFVPSLSFAGFIFVFITVSLPARHDPHNEGLLGQALASIGAYDQISAVPDVLIGFLDSESKTSTSKTRALVDWAAALGCNPVTADHTSSLFNIVLSVLAGNDLSAPPDTESSQEFALWIREPDVSARFNHDIFFPLLTREQQRHSPSELSKTTIPQIIVTGRSIFYIKSQQNSVETIQDVFGFCDEGLDSLAKIIQEIVPRQLSGNVRSLDIFKHKYLSSDSCPNTNRARDYYFEAESLCDKPTKQNLESAAERYSAAIELNPKFALSYVGMAEVIANLQSRRFEPWSFRRLQEAERFAKAAIEIDNHLQEAHTALGFVYYTFGKFYKYEVKQSGKSAARALAMKRGAIQYERAADDALFSALENRGRNSLSTSSTLLRLALIKSRENPDVSKGIYEDLIKVATNNTLDAKASVNLGNIVFDEINWGDVVDEELFSRALGHYLDAIERNPEMGSGYFNIGCLYAKTDDLEKSTEYLLKAFKCADRGYNLLIWEDDDLKIFRENPEYMERLESALKPSA